MNAPYKRILALDFETAWGRAAQLGFSCQTNEEYIRDQRFKAWGLAFKWVGEEGACVWIRHSHLVKWFESVDWSTTAVVCHNAQFDCTILSWIYGVNPCFIFDTLSMGRALRGVEVGNSLKKLAEDYKLPPKGDGLSPSENILDTLPFAVEQTLADYCKHDTWLCEQLFLKMVEGYPAKELRLIDLTVRMYTQACLRLDAEMLEKAIDEEEKSRVALLERLGVDESALASNPQFAAILEGLGIDPPKKVSKTTGQETLALAKNDALFQALLNSNDETIATLCETRIRVKSTSERTRAQRFLAISTRGALPVPLSYFGASTGRYTASRGSAINMQNLKRGSFLRKAIMAPKGYTLVVGDLSQIEPRVLAWLSDYKELLQVFEAGGDPYAAFGAQMFQIPGMTKETHKVERQSAKSALLGAGYMLGWASFAAQLLTGFLGADPIRYAKDDAKKLGVSKFSFDRFLSWEENVTKMQAIPHSCTEEELLVHCLAAQAIIDKYRTTARAVVGFWEVLGTCIERSLYRGVEFNYKDVLLFRKGEIVLPSGLAMKYPDLQPSEDAKGRVQWSYWGGKKREKLYSGKVCNNCTQGIARCVMTDGMLRVGKRYFVAGTVHDEQIVVVPEKEVDEAKAWVLDQMTIEPKYLPGISLAAEVGAHVRYGLAKG